MQTFKTQAITLLVQCFDEHGVMRFPNDEQTYFGLNMTIDHTLAVSKQAGAHVARFMGRPDLEPLLEPLTTIEPILESPGHQPSLLYLMRLAQARHVVSSNWPPFAPFLRSLPQGRMRVAYNKALQYFAGAADDAIDILELDAEVQERLARLMAERPHSLLE
jgi:hypothetical protein